MSICPECKEIINYLYWNQSKHSFGTFDLKDEYETDSNSDISGTEITFSCPDCDKKLFDDEDEAREFLENKDKLNEIIEKRILDE